jgi:thiamine transporter ThiT
MALVNLLCYAGNYSLTGDTQLLLDYYLWTSEIRYSVVFAKSVNQGESSKTVTHLSYTGTVVGPVEARSCGTGSPVLK